MSGLMQQENAALSERVTDLSRRAEFERAAAPVVREGWRRDEAHRGRVSASKRLGAERSQRQRAYDGPARCNKPDGAFGGDLR